MFAQYSQVVVVDDEDSIEVVTYADLLVLLCIFVNTSFIAVHL
jgi:hypothetical protein